MEPKKWIAQWIEYNPEPLKTNPVFKNNAQIFYKKFNLTKQPQKAFIDICGLGFYYLKIQRYLTFGNDYEDSILQRLLNADFSFKLFYISAILYILTD